MEMELAVICRLGKAQESFYFILFFLETKGFPKLLSGEAGDGAALPQPPHPAL